MVQVEEVLLPLLQLQIQLLIHEVLIASWSVVCGWEGISWGEEREDDLDDVPSVSNNPMNQKQNERYIVALRTRNGS